jgi:uncharacterized lipoprotein YmbA
MLLLIGACMGSPQASFYTLRSEPLERSIDSDEQFAIAIESVTVPDIVDRPQLVLRVSNTQVRIDEFARWAEPLKSQIADTMAADLARQFPNALVSSAAQLTGKSTFHVYIDVQTLESTPGDAVSVTVLWSVRASKQGGTISGKSVVREPTDGPGYDALVAAHSRALASVSSDIAGAIVSGLRK